MVMFDKMYEGKIKGGMIFGHNPAQSMPNTHKIREAMQNLEWLVVGEAHDTETSSFWHGPGLDPKKVKTEVFCCLPASAAKRRHHLQLRSLASVALQRLRARGQEPVHGLDDR
jgi:formate dehydrogenase alpha subunit (EC 1.2.1.2)